MNYPFIIHKSVVSSQVDFNQHMHDAEYNSVFSEVISEFNHYNGLSLKEREALNYTTFTVEEHTTYLKELHFEESFSVRVRIYNYNEKRVHFFLELFKNDETLAATSEIMMMGINRSTRRPASFPAHYKSNIQIYYDSQYDKRWPKSLGHQIGIPKKGEA